MSEPATSRKLLESLQLKGVVRPDETWVAQLQEAIDIDLLRAYIKGRLKGMLDHG